MKLSTIILTLNEAIHIRRCIESLRPLDGNVFVVDSFSTDSTVELARELGAQVCQNAWQGLYSVQFNWALDNLPITTDWVLRLDADEYVCPELIDEIKAKLDALPEDVTGVEVNLRRVFMGRHIRRGMPRIKMLRLFRYGKARCEQRLMDEHMELQEGRTVAFDGEFADDNLNDLSWWTQKHIGYAIREAADLLDMEYGLLGEVREFESSKVLKLDGAAEEGEVREFESSKVLKLDGAAEEGEVREFESSKVQKSGNATNQTIEHNGADSISASSKKTSELPNSRTLELPHKLGGQAAAKRRMKMKYVRAPLFWRALVYFCMRYFARGGFLEGKEGFMWHFFQGLWYRMLVDSKIWEIKRECGSDKKKMLELLRGKYGLKI